MAKYQDLKAKLSPQLRGCRDRQVRVKVELILLAARLGSVSEACSRRGFSRKFYYKWWGRLKRARYNLWGLEEKSRRPHRSPGRISGELEKKIRRIHRTGAGSRMIRGILSREQQALSHATICHVLNGRKPAKKSRKEQLKRTAGVTSWTCRASVCRWT